MERRLLAAARTPWVRRLGALAEVHPEVLLATAIDGALARAGIGAADCDLLLVACDTPVGAQATDLARRVARRLGADHLPALTVDGQGVGDLALVGLVPVGATAIVAGVDSTSIVPPGAALVRDYGRPTPDETTETGLLEHLAAKAGLDRGALDRAAAALLAAPAPPAGPVVAVRVGRSAVGRDDAGDPPPGELAAVVDDGLVTAAHHAGLADGAAAVVVGPHAGRPLPTTGLLAGRPEDLVDTLVRACDEAWGPTVLADASAVIHLLLDRRGVRLLGPDGGVAAVLRTGTVPSADGLRALADAAEAVTGPCVVVRRGRGGQVAHVALGAREPAPDRPAPSGDRAS